MPSSCSRTAWTSTWSVKRWSRQKPEQEVDTTDCLQYEAPSEDHTNSAVSYETTEETFVQTLQQKNPIKSLLVGRILILLSQHCAVIHHCCLYKVTFNHTDSKTCSSQTIKQVIMCWICTSCTWYKLPNHPNMLNTFPTMTMLHLYIHIVQMEQWMQRSHVHTVRVGPAFTPSTTTHICTQTKSHPQSKGKDVVYFDWTSLKILVLSDFQLIQQVIWIPDIL